jgi:cholesterol transport system auxiliary component
MNVRTRAALLSPLLGLLLLAGCALPGKPTQPVRFHVLTDPGPVAPSAVTREGTLLVREMEAPPLYQDTRLIFSRTPGTRSQYQYARWSEPTPRRLSWMLRQRLETAGVFKGVAPLGGGIQGDYQLNTRLVDFYHDAATPPGVALVVLEAELVRRETATLQGRRLFAAQVPAATFDAEGAADALGRGANQIMDELAGWLVEITAR